MTVPDKADAMDFTRLPARGRLAAHWRLLLLPLLPLLPLPVAPAAAQTQADAGRRLEGAHMRVTHNVLGYELVPSFTGTFKAAPFRTNRWGMRDKEYELKPPRGTYRIAFLGSSFSMGGGVPEEQTHEALLEDRLNREGPGTPSRRIEILNFSVGGYGLLQYVALMEKKIFTFSPNAVIIVIHSTDVRILAKLTSLLRAGIPIEDPYLRQTLQKAGVQPGMEAPELRRRLSSVSLDLVKWSYQRIAQRCREHGVPLVGIAFEEPRQRGQEQVAEMAALASEAGIPVLDLKGVYDGRSLSDVKLRPGDVHLNVLGHKLVADRLYGLLRENDARTLKLGFRDSQ